jgi:hypothetical protein
MARIVDGNNIDIGEDATMATQVLLRHGKEICRFPGVVVYECDYWRNGNKYNFHIPDETLIKAKKRRYFHIKNAIAGPRQ